MPHSAACIGPMLISLLQSARRRSHSVAPCKKDGSQYIKASNGSIRVTLSFPWLDFTLLAKILAEEASIDVAGALNPAVSLLSRIKVSSRALFLCPKASLVEGNVILPVISSSTSDISSTISACRLYSPYTTWFACRRWMINKSKLKGGSSIPCCTFSTKFHKWLALNLNLETTIR